MVDKQGILDHLRELDAALQDWKRYKNKISLEDLREDRDKRNMVLHAMFVAIQSAIDTGTHLVAEYRLRKPASYRETFEILRDHGLIEEPLAADLSDLAGFRNVLAHIYWRLDLDRVHAILTGSEGVLGEFLRKIKDLLKQQD